MKMPCWPKLPLDGKFPGDRCGKQLNLAAILVFWRAVGWYRMGGPEANKKRPSTVIASDLTLVFRGAKCCKCSTADAGQIRSLIDLDSNALLLDGFRLVQLSQPTGLWDSVWTFWEYSMGSNTTGKLSKAKYLNPDQLHTITLGQPVA